MSLFKEVATKAAQSFLSLDDVVLGQGVLSSSLGQLGQAGRSLAGSVALSSNVAARAVCVGVQVGAKTARVTAGALQGWVPGAGLASRLAQQLDQQAARVGAEAAQLATHGVELAAPEPADGEGSSPRNPLTGEQWLAKGLPSGYGWRQLAADTAVDSWGRLALLPAAFGLDALRVAAASRPGRLASETTSKVAHRALDTLPGQAASQLDTEDLRQSLLALAGASGGASLRQVLAFGEAGWRLLFGDTRRLRRVINEGLDEMALLAGHGELEDLLPLLPLSRTLRESAQQVVDNPPRLFLAALAGADPGALLTALVDDAKPLRIFAIYYPQALSLLSAHAGLAVSAGLGDVSEIEAYVRGDSDRRPASAAQLEAHVGKALVGEALGRQSSTRGAFPRSAVRLAQEVVFLYASQVLGRQRALERSERLHGVEVRQRLAADPSLRDEISAADAGVAGERAIRAHIASSSSGRLNQERRNAERQLASLEAFSDLLLKFPPSLVERRLKALRTFLSLAHQRLALADQVKPGAARRAAFAGFSAWVDGG